MAYRRDKTTIYCPACPTGVIVFRFKRDSNNVLVDAREVKGTCPTCGTMYHALDVVSSVVLWDQPDRSREAKGKGMMKGLRL